VTDKQSAATVSPANEAHAAAGVGGPIASLAAQSERLEMCIHCGFCLDACPTYTRGGDESDSPRGRLYLMRAVAEGRIPAASDAFRTHLDRCLGCRACEPVCPSGVEYGFLLERGREAIAKARGVSMFERVLLATFGSPSLNAIVGLIARVLRGAGLARLAVRVIPGRFRRLRMTAAMLEASRPWRGRRGAIPTGSADPGGRSNGGLRVVVFEGCVQKTLFGRVNAATRSVMKHNGHSLVSVPGLRCCGALHAHGGDLDGARALASHNLEALASFVTGDNGSAVNAIIVNAAGCGAMMQEYGKLFEGRPEAGLADAVSHRIRDPLVFLAEHGVRSVTGVKLRAAWDSPCHLIHGQRAGGTPIDVARAALPATEIVPVPHHDECCGGAGIHALVHGGYTDRVLADKLDAVRSVDADVVLSANPGCIMQIGGGLVMAGDTLRVIHPMELLARPPV
jgi:glycolate oxidase iron-sulfur subunit